MRCGQCNKLLGRGIAFCPYCGAKLRLNRRILPWLASAIFVLFSGSIAGAIALGQSGAVATNSLPPLPSTTTPTTALSLTANPPTVPPSATSDVGATATAIQLVTIEALVAASATAAMQETLIAETAAADAALQAQQAQTVEAQAAAETAAAQEIARIEAVTAQAQAAQAAAEATAQAQAAQATAQIVQAQTATRQAEQEMATRYDGQWYLWNGRPNDDSLIAWLAFDISQSTVTRLYTLGTKGGGECSASWLFENLGVSLSGDNLIFRGEQRGVTISVNLTFTSTSTATGSMKIEGVCNYETYFDNARDLIENK